MLAWYLLLIPTLGVILAFTARRYAPHLVQPQGESTIATTTHHTALWRLIGLFTGLLAAWWLTANTDQLGLNLALAPSACALGILTGVLVGELTARPTTNTTRSPTLEVRSIRSYLPITTTRWVLGLTTTLLLLLTITSLTSTADTIGHSGRALTVTCGPDSTQIVSPWPGTYYALPIAAAALVAGALAIIVLRTLVNRARPNNDEHARTADDTLRTRTAHTIISAYGLLIAASLAGTTLFTGLALVRVCTTHFPGPTLAIGALIITGIAVIACGIFTINLIPRQ